MCHKYCVEAADRSFGDIVLRKLRAIQWRLPTNSSSIIRTLESSDFASCVWSSALYAGFRILRLGENMRLSSLRNEPNATERAPQFPNYLPRLVKWRLTAIDDGMVELPESPQHVLDIYTLCGKVFDSLEWNFSDVSWLTFRAILSTKPQRNERPSVLKVSRELQDIPECLFS